MKLSAEQIRGRKGGVPIAILTAYTFPVARSVERAGVPVILVGDTLGMVEMGFDSTRHVTMDHMCYHIGAVRRGAPDTHIIGDMPYGSDDEPQNALRNARRLLDAGADSVKLEGRRDEAIRLLRTEGIDVVGHTGLTPQTAANFKQVGKDEEDAQRLLDDAKCLAELGCFLLVLEHIPAALGKRITQAVNIPTIGIGAGGECDGQVLVINDMLGLGDRWPPFSKQYQHFGQLIQDAATQYRDEVETRRFP